MVARELGAICRASKTREMWDAPFPTTNPHCNTQELRNGLKCKLGDPSTGYLGVPTAGRLSPDKICYQE